MITMTMLLSAIIVALVVALLFQGIALSRANDKLKLQRTIIEATNSMLDSIRLPPVSVEYNVETGEAEINVGEHLAACVVLRMEDGPEAEHGKAIVRLLQTMSKPAPNVTNTRKP